MATETISKVLDLEFITDENTERKLSVNNPLDDLKGEDVANKMNEIVLLNTVCDTKGNLVTTAVGATITTTTKDRLF